VGRVQSGPVNPHLQLRVMVKVDVEVEVRPTRKLPSSVPPRSLGTRERMAQQEPGEVHVLDALPRLGSLLASTPPERQE